MGTVIGDVLPLAMGVAISPVPIIAAILMLLSPQAKKASIGFLIGWVVGIAVAITLFTILGSAIPDKSDESASPAAAVIRIALGVGLLLLALKQWRDRPSDPKEATLPSWMSAIESMTVQRATTLAFLLAAVNPKNLLMALSAGILIGGGGLSTGHAIVAMVVFTLLAAISVAAPVVAYLIAADRMTKPLESLRGWLVPNNAAVMTVLLLVIGVTVIGNGISSF